MSFFENIEASKELVFLGVIKPSARLFDLEVGSLSHIYLARLEASFVSSFKFNNTTFSAVSSLSDLDTPSANRYFFDRSAKIIYLDLSSQGVALDEDVLVAEYEFHLASKEIIFHRDPEDDQTELVSYEPYLDQNLSLKKSVDNNIDGFMPALSSQATLINTDYVVSSMLDRATLSRKEATFYALSGEPETDNLFKYISGIITRVSVDDNKISLSISDLIFTFDGSYTFIDNIQTYDQAQTSLSNLDPAFEGHFIPRVLGTVNSLPLANVEYEPSNGSFSDNNNYIVCKHYGGAANSNMLSYTISSSGSTSTVLNTADGITGGDEIILTNSGHLKHYCFVTSVNYDTNTIFHTGGRDFSPSNGTTIYKHRVCNVHQVNTQNLTGTLYKRNDDPGNSTQHTYLLDYVNIPSDPWQVLRITANHGGDLDDDRATYTKFFARVMGEPVIYPLNGAFLNLSDKGYHSKAHHVIYQYLIEQMQFLLDDINVDSFEALESDLENQFDIGLSIPLINEGTQIPTHRDVISPILKSSFLSLYQDSNGKIALKRIDKIDSFSKNITEDEILNISYKEDYTETSRLSRIEFRPATQVIGPRTSPTEASIIVANFNNKFDTFLDSDISNLHSTQKTKNLKTILFDKDQASDFAKKYFTIFGYGFNTYDITLPLEFSDINVGDSVKISRKLLPGFVDLGVVNEVFARVLSLTVGSKDIKITVWTQRGIQDSQGVW